LGWQSSDDGGRAAGAGGAPSHPTERDVVRLVSEGLGNKDIATRLFVSPRTVQTHLTHVYNKLGAINLDIATVEEPETVYRIDPTDPHPDLSTRLP
jgi:DNA-binding CsgD family transcriptional regulator